MAWRNIVVKELIVAYLFILIPFLPLLHLSWSVNSMEIFGLNIPLGYEDTQTFMWYLLTEISLTAIYSIFFLFLAHPIRWVFLGFASYYFSVTLYVILGMRSDFIFTLEWSVISIIYAEQLIFLRYSLVPQLNSFKQHASNLELVKEIFDHDNQKFNRLVGSLKKSANPKGLHSQIYQLYHLTNIGKTRVKKYQNNPHKKIGRNSILGSATVVLLTIFLLFKYFYTHIPVENDSYNFFGLFQIGDFGFADVNSFIWYFLGKLEIISSCFVWLIFNKEWWGKMIIPGICLYVFQLIEIFEPTVTIESSVAFRAIPITLAVLMIFWIVTKTMLIKAKFLDNVTYLESELERKLGGLE